ncbi:MAG TPA: LacI family DNA-binding transcriptional regulator [Pyrinomonadaceae bacterium]|nr:LacI family DNA-binding transcriptional regulator [Pyrinomonadaceae bacterium]
MVAKKDGNRISDVKTAGSGRGVTLKELADAVGLTPGTLSVVLNNTHRASTIPEETKERIFKAAKDLNYRPNYFARSLRANRSFTIGVIAAELSDGYCAMILNGIESGSTEQGYFYLNTSHLHREDLLKHNSQMLIQRQVEGIITIDTPIRFECDLPIVSIAGHEAIEGVTNVILNHQTAAEIGIEHLYSLGHRKIAVIKGQDFSSDTKIRWETIVQAARDRGIGIDEKLVVELEGINPSPEVGYVAARKLLANKRDFTAIFAFNDISAIGAIRALQEAGLRVPEDVSVLGFDDIYIAPYFQPSLTTIRQPLFEMGKLSAQTLLRNLSKIENKEEIPKIEMVEPELIVRNSTAKVNNSKS